MINLHFIFEDQSLRAIPIKNLEGWSLTIKDLLTAETQDIVMSDEHFAMLLSIMVQGDEDSHNPDYHAILAEKYFNELPANLRLIP